MSGPHFAYRQKVLFKHCDPAGIVFYPRYVEMLNDTTEAMFSELLDWPYESMHPDSGVPTASLKVDFKAPSRHGDWLDFNVTIERIGGSSITFTIVGQAGEDVRLTAELTLVLINEVGRPKRWPDTIRQKVNQLLEENP